MEIAQEIGRAAVLLGLPLIPAIRAGKRQLFYGNSMATSALAGTVVYTVSFLPIAGLALLFS